MQYPPGYPRHTWSTVPGQSVIPVHARPGSGAVDAIIMHVPLMQNCPAPQTFPHRPQLELSADTSRHTPPHTRFGAAHGVTHAPAVQSWPAAQRFPHRPQLARSPETSEQLVPHIIRGAGQVLMHVELLHACPAPHARPQPPQLAPSDAMLTHDEPHRVAPTGHTHTPAEHAVPAGQAFPQLPQLVGSDEVSLQRAPHIMRGEVQPDTVWHLPPMQICDGEHRVLHAPQLASSVVVSRQKAPQRVNPPGHPAGCTSAGGMTGLSVGGVGVSVGGVTGESVGGVDVSIAGGVSEAPESVSVIVPVAPLAVHAAPKRHSASMSPRDVGRFMVGWLNFIEFQGYFRGKGHHAAGGGVDRIAHAVKQSADIACPR